MYVAFLRYYRFQVNFKTFNVKNYSLQWCDVNQQVEFLHNMSCVLVWTQVEMSRSMKNFEYDVGHVEEMLHYNIMFIEQTL